ncbi:calcium-binding protein [Microcystis aeruginosa]|uniref:calcium-binding protein n=1 Tax=Microcystis aeruginosa TaxID=1126 RepID=UPI00232B986B|nr:calcium-binding protein [Microcystis aeruginosa]MDB9412754.1 calcium-binding protein [Microcystis aeruginosa CS-567/02]
MSGTVAQVLNFNPTLPISLSATVTADNLTFIGLFADGDAVWRIDNAGPAVTGVTLASTVPGFTTSLDLAANSQTFVRSTVGGTHKLTIGAATFTKAAGTTTISLGNPPAPTGQTTIAPINNALSYNITGSAFNDSLVGGLNADTITGGLGADTLRGNSGADSLNGEAGDDSLDGGSGNDTLLGGTGNDTLLGGTGNDILTGGAGADHFAYDNTNQGVDTITDFSTAQVDFIQISASGPGFAGSGLVAGLLPGIQFFSSATAGPGSGDANTRFIYNTTSGNLWFDRDGTGATASVQLATLTNLPAAFDHSYINIV